MNVSRRGLRRAVVLMGMVGATAGAAMLVPATASAATPIGADPGHLHLPASGNMSDKPTWSTDTACGTNFQSSAKLYVVPDSGTPFAVSGTVTPVNAPFTGTLQGTLAFIQTAGGLQNGSTYEFVVECQTAALAQDPEQSTFLTISADGSTYTTSATVPTNAVATTTTLTANPTTPTAGSPVTLTATVAASDTAGNDAVGSVQFFNGATSLGTAAVSGGQATLTTTTLPVGSNSITATFTPTDATKFKASTSSAQTVTVSGGAANTETLTVAVGSQTSGSLTLTVSNTPVSLSQPASNGTVLDGTGKLSAVTVSDSRLPSQPGWDLTGAVSDFNSGSNTFSGADLGWTPQIATANANKDVTPGAVVTAGTNPGLKGGAPLASAAAGKGGGTTVLGAGLDLQIPFTTPAGNYSATLTVTLTSK
jgi:hypothetical protein